MAANLERRLRYAAKALRALGPYVLLEILLPGGTLFALALFLYRRHRLTFVGDAWRAVSGTAEVVGDAFDDVALAFRPFFEGVETTRRERRRLSAPLLFGPLAV